MRWLRSFIICEVFFGVVPDFVVEKGHVNRDFGVGVFFGEELFEQGRHARKQVGLFLECAFLLTAWGAQLFVRMVECWVFMTFIGDVLERGSDVDLDGFVCLGLIVPRKSEWMFVDFAGTRLS